MQRWFAWGVPTLTVILLVLALVNAIAKGGQSAWLSVAGVAALLAAIVAAGYGRFR